ncbi:MAG: hypothetical protein LBU58_12365, partial [Clostridiales bacterium]|nr:hypothetical protein [Clostridiales bacterium]
MRKKSSVSFSSLRTGHVIEILAGIVYPLERLLEAALGKTEYTIRRALIVCAFSAALEIVFVLMITMTRKEREERLAFLMPMASYATVLIGSFVTADFEFFFLITLALFVISCVYQNFFRNLQFFVVSNALNVFLFVFYFPSLDVSVTRVSYSSTRIDPAGILIIDWFIAFAASFALLILTHLLTRRSGAANRGLMSFDTLLQTTPNYTVLVDEMKQVLYISEPLARFAHIADRRMARGRPLLDLFGERSLKLLFYDVIDSEGPFDETRE